MKRKNRKIKIDGEEYEKLVFFSKTIQNIMTAKAGGEVDKEKMNAELKEELMAYRIFKELTSKK